ncbi:MAG TPA: YhbY family RNA-binding protein [Polyangia bacterium]|nr:YhbY family RNA-binding protein [Polyangia bacterium]
MTLMPPSDLRRALRGHGHAMSPIVQVGKLGVTDALVKQVNHALADHELIKVKIGGECPLDRHAVAERLDAEPGVDVVQLVGRVILLYKRHPQKPRYEGKRAQAAADATAKPPARKSRKRSTGKRASGPPSSAARAPRRGSGRISER